MFRSIVRFISVSLLAIPVVAGADWEEVSSEQLVMAADQSIIRHEWTGSAVDSTPYDVSACSGKVEARFDPSLLDSSTDASAQIRMCRASGDTWQRCRSVMTFEGSHDGTTWYQVNAVAQGENYIMTHATSDTSGGDIARSEVRCTEGVDMAASTSSSGSGIVGWPSFESIGGTGRPTQAIVIDSLAYSSKLTGSGRDDNGGTWDGSCTANATTDQPCTGVSTISSLAVSVEGAGSAFNTSINWDIEADPQAALFCRDSTSFAHEIGTAGDTTIAADGDYIATVLRDDSSDTYRLLSMDASSADCAARTGNLNTRNEITYPTAVEDDLMIFLHDAVHMSPYGMRWTAQEVLTASWEDMFPEMLGVTNLITNGYMETTCTDGSPLTLAGGGSFAARAGNNTLPSNVPVVGQGCTWDEAADADGRTATTATIAAEPGAYYNGSVVVASNGTASNQRSLIVRIRDNSGTNLTNVKFWLGGQTTGVGAESVDTVDATGVATPGEYQIRERMCFAGSCIVKFAFQVPAGATGFDIQFEQTNVATQYDVYIDELWVRKKLHQDLNRHYIIADGKAKIQLFTDSRGNPARYEALQYAFDYMLGETTNFGQVRSEGSLRPDLHLEEKVSDNTYWISGAQLGDFVGENDGHQDYEGAASTFSELSTLVESGTNYCLAYFGINDITDGARPTSSSLNSDTEANRNYYFADQLRGFEIAAEQNGCIPIVIMEPPQRGDSTTTTCVTAGDVVSNCATWHRELWKNVLHNGLP